MNGSCSTHQCPVGSSCNYSQDYSIDDVKDGPAIVSLVSSSLSIISSLCIIATYFVWPNIRSVSRQIIVFLSLADLFTALGYVIGSINHLQYDRNDTRGVTTACETFTRVCVVQSTITSWSSIASFWWTSILAFHLYITLVKGHVSLSGRLLPLYYFLSWVTPTVVVMALLWSNQLGYSHVAVSTWCFIGQKSEGQKFLEIILVLLGGKLWEVITYGAVLILYTLTKLHVSRGKIVTIHRINLSVGGVAAVRRIDHKLIFIPVVFFLLRLWGTIQFIVVSAISIRQCQCVSHDAYVIISILAYLQAIGDGGQGWGNFILYMFGTKELRDKMFCCCQPWSNPDSLETSRHNRFYTFNDDTFRQ